MRNFIFFVFLWNWTSSIFDVTQSGKQFWIIQLVHDEQNESAHYRMRWIHVISRDNLSSSLFSFIQTLWIKQLWASHTRKNQRRSDFKFVLHSILPKRFNHLEYSTWFTNYFLLFLILMLCSFLRIVSHSPPSLSR